MTFLTLSSVGYDLPNRSLFQNLDFSFSDSRVGLVGDNGVGKSTLAKILCGQLEPTEGHVVRRGEVLYLSQFSGDATDEFGEAPAFASGGERRRARLANLFARVASLEGEGRDVFVILDEPTNDLDREGRTFVHTWVRSRGGGLLVISHDRELLAELDDIVELSPQGLRAYGGGFANYLETSRRERANAAARVEEAQRELRKKKREKHEKLAAQEKRSQRAKAAAPLSGIPRILLGARKRRAQVTQGNIEMRESKRIDVADSELAQAALEVSSATFLRLDFEADARPASQVLVLAENLQLGAGPRWPKPLTFQLRARDRVWLRGRNGLGKSSLMDVLRDRGRSVEGVLTRAAVLSEVDRVGFLDQHQSGLRVTDTVLEAIEHSTRFTSAELRHELSFYGFTADRVFLKVSQLSGGERLRLALAQIFLASKLPALLILDEPTNNLDFRSLEILRAAIENFPGGILLITHDETFGKSLARFAKWDLETNLWG